MGLIMSATINGVYYEGKDEILERLSELLDIAQDDGINDFIITVDEA